MNNRVNYFILIVLLVVACKQRQNPKENNLNTVDTTSVKTNKEKNTADINDSEAIQAIKKFYASFYFTDNIEFDDNTLSNFISKRLLNYMNALRTEDNYILDYDPFIKAQDFNGEVIKKTFKVEASPDKINEFKVHFNVFQLENEPSTEIILHVIKNENTYMIDAINNDSMLNLDELEKHEAELTKYIDEASEESIVCNKDISQFITFLSIDLLDDKYKKSYPSIPIILKNDSCNFSVERYPDQLHFKVIPNAIDTIIVLKARDIENEACYQCLEITKIETLQGNKNLYYDISQNNNVIIQKGSIEDILEKRNLSFSDLDLDNSYQTYENMIGSTDLPEILQPSYIFNSDPSWKENISIKDIHKKIHSSKSIDTTLQSLQKEYSEYIANHEHVSFDNLLSEEQNGYFHSGGFTVEKDYYINIETINIIFISQKNKMYTVEWINDWEELIRVDYQPPFDDNEVEAVNETYQINKWDNNSKINLFHPDMSFGKYLIVYEIKLKQRDVYIQSPIEIITYKKP